MEKENAKLEYHAPKLERFGTLSELTQAGFEGTGRDLAVYRTGTAPGRGD